MLISSSIHSRGTRPLRVPISSASRGLGREHSLPRVLKDYSYSAPALVIRAGWFIPFAIDAAENEAYYDLLFGRVFTKREEFIKAFGLIDDKRLCFGLIEGSSGVIVQRKRWIGSIGSPRGYACSNHRPACFVATTRHW